MQKKLFLGIADDNRVASAVVGDSAGNIIASREGGSVNYHFWGIEQSRLNLKNIIRDTVGWDRRDCLAGVCFTYKAGLAISNWEVLQLVSGLLGESRVQVEDFVTISTLGISSAKDRLLLIGGHSGIAIFRGATGQSSYLMHEALEWNPSLRLQRHADLAESASRKDRDGFLHLKAAIQAGGSLFNVARCLDYYVDQGNALALAIAHEVALDLVRLVMKVARQTKSMDPVIGFYGQILLGSEIIRARVQHLIQFLFPQSTVIDAPLAPAKGAYLSSLVTGKPDREHELIHDCLM